MVDFHREIIRVIDSNLSKLSDAVRFCLSSFAQKMFEKGFISETVMNNPETFCKVVSEFKANFLFVERVEDIESKFMVFLDIFRDLGGPLKTAADKMEEEIKQAIEREMERQRNKLVLKPRKERNSMHFLVDHEIPTVVKGFESPLFLLPDVFRGMVAAGTDHQSEVVTTEVGDRGLEPDTSTNSGPYDSKEVAQPEDKVMKPNSASLLLHSTKPTAGDGEQHVVHTRGHCRWGSSHKEIVMDPMPPRVETVDSPLLHQHEQHQLCIPPINNQPISPSQEETSYGNERHPLSLTLANTTEGGHHHGGLGQHTHLTPKDCKRQRSPKKSFSQDDVSIQYTTSPGYSTMKSCPSCVELTSLKQKFMDEQKLQIEELKQKLLQFEQQRESEKEKEREEFQAQTKLHEEKISNKKSELKRRQTKLENSEHQLIKDQHEFQKEVQRKKSDQDHRESLLELRKNELKALEEQLEKKATVSSSKKAELKKMDDEVKAFNSKLIKLETELKEQERTLRKRELDHIDHEKKEVEHLQQRNQEISRKWNLYWKENAEMRQREKEIWKSEAQIEERERNLESKEKKYSLIRNISLALFVILLVLVFLNVGCFFKFIHYNFIYCSS